MVQDDHYPMEDKDEKGDDAFDDNGIVEEEAFRV